MVRPELDIPPRVERDGESRRLVERKPGAGETITLSWPSYFPPTVNDTKLATSAAKDASGGKQLLSRKSALEWLSSHFGVQDIDEELLALEDDAEKAREDAEAIFGGGPPVRTNALPPRTREPADKPSSPADQEEGDEGDER